MKAASAARPGPSLLGLTISGYLALVQLRLIAGWDPFFASGGRAVLASPTARVGGIPDSLLAVAAFLLAALVGGFALRPGRSPFIRLAFGSVALCIWVGGMATVVGQAFVIHAWSSLSLAAAAVAAGLGAVGTYELSRALEEIELDEESDSDGTAHSTS